MILSRHLDYTTKFLWFLMLVSILGAYCFNPAVHAESLNSAIPIESVVDALNNDTLEDIPPEISGKLPPNLAEELPPEASGEIPPNLAEELPPKASGEIPPNLPEELPPETSGELPPDLPVELPPESSGELPPDLPVDLPPEVSGELPPDLPEELPPETPVDTELIPLAVNDQILLQVTAIREYLYILLFFIIPFTYALFFVFKFFAWFSRTFFESAL